MIEKDELQQLISKYSCKEIADIKKCSKASIYKYAKKYNLKWPEIDLIGYSYEYLTVVDKIGSKGTKGKQSIYWKVLCKCGNCIEKSTKSIRRNEHKSCGCFFKNKEYRTKNKHWNGYEDIHGKWFSGLKRGAKSRGHEFNITIEYIWDLYVEQGKKCALTGRDLVFAQSSKGFQNGCTTASLDRIDSTIGYIKGNVQWVHKDVNLSKQRLNNVDFIQLCQEVCCYAKEKQGQ